MKCSKNELNNLIFIQILEIQEKSCNSILKKIQTKYRFYSVCDLQFPYKISFNYEISKTFW